VANKNEIPPSGKGTDQKSFNSLKWLLILPIIYRATQATTHNKA